MQLIDAAKHPQGIQDDHTELTSDINRNALHVGSYHGGHSIGEPATRYGHSEARESKIENAARMCHGDARNLRRFEWNTGAKARLCSIRERRSPKMPSLRHRHVVQ